MWDKAVVHYDEIAIKGKNRSFFEKALVRELNCKFKKENLTARAQNSWGRIYITDLGDDIEKVRQILQRTPGVAYFGFAKELNSYTELLDFAPKAAELVKSSTFRVSAKRIDKSFSKKSFEIEREFASKMFESDPKLKVNLKDFEKELKIELLSKSKILFYVKEKSLGGLAVSSSGRAVLLLSAGFDSPVAGFLLQKRGVEIFPLHFHSAPKTGQEPIEATKELARILSKNQCKMQLALAPVLEVQKYIANNAPEKLRIVLLRRVFARIANKYAEKVGALALITGESVGQVASQTLENIFVINQASQMPILRPLSGMNKNEIIDIARKIGTYEISARPCEDTCSLFLPDNPETKAHLDEVLKVESNLPDLKLLEDKVLESLEIVEF